MNISLKGKKALVTGGTSGIGHEIVLTLARAGADVMTCYRQDDERANRLTRELKEISGDHHVVRADVCRPDDIDRLAADITAGAGSLDIIVNNAGAISHVPFAQLPLEEWQRIIDTNLTGAFLVIQKTLPLLSSTASVINIGSGVATVGVPLRAHYTAAKAGLIGLTRSLAKELGPRGIRVNVVAPGPTETGNAVPPDVLRRYQQMIALGRLGRPEDVAGVVLFLASDMASFVSAETIHVDGGI